MTGWVVHSADTR